LLTYGVTLGDEMSKLIPTYIEQSVRVEQLERELVAEKEWVRQSTNSNARLEKFLAEAQAEVVRLKGEIDELRAALAETQMPTKICGPNLVGILNAAGFYRKKEWVGLTGTEINHIFAANVGYPERMMKEVETLLKEKNT